MCARRNYKIHEIDSLEGGIDLDSSPFNVQKDCVISVSNMLPSLNVGGVSVRNGIVKHNSVAIQESSVAKTITGLYSLYAQGGINEYFVAQAGTKLYKNNPEGTWSSITGTLSFTDNGNNLASFDVLNNILYGADRSNDNLWSWSLSGNATVIGSPPTGGGTFLVSFNRSIWLGGNSSTPLLLFYSTTDDGTIYSNSNFLNFDEGMGSKLTGAVRTLTGNLIVFKDKSISVVQTTGSTPAYTKYLFVDGVGCVSHQSIVTLPGGFIMWWDTDDIYIMVGNQVKSATSHPKTKTPRLRNFFRNVVNQSRLQYVTGVYYPMLDIARFFYSTAGSNVNNAHIDYHVKTESWWLGTLRGTSCCNRVVQGQPRIYAGDTNGFSYRQDYQTNDDGSAIPWNIQTPWQVFEGITVRKKLDLIYTVISKQSNYNVLCDVYFDQSQTAAIVGGVLSTLNLSGATWDTAMFDVDDFPVENSLLEASLAVNRLFKSVSININGNSVDQPVDIFKVAFTERPLEFTRGTT